MSFDSSLRQARTITQYWKDRGFTVEPRLEAMPGKGIIEPHYTVRSDMLGGWPREMAAQVMKGKRIAVT